MNTSLIIGKKIALIRKTKGISQESLAEMANIHRTYISQIERGIKSPTINIIIAILKSLNIKISDFFKDIENDLFKK